MRRWRDTEVEPLAIMLAPCQFSKRGSGGEMLHDNTPSVGNEGLTPKLRTVDEPSITGGIVVLESEIVSLVIGVFVTAT